MQNAAKGSGCFDISPALFSLERETYMAKFCGKCGSKLDETTGLCPNCDAAKIKRYYDRTMRGKNSVQEEEIDQRAKKKALKAEKKAAKKEEQMNRAAGKKGGRTVL